MIFSMHQPCYFPWLGLLSKTAGSDVLILLDEVQLSDSSFQHRNQFLSMDGKVRYLSIPFIKQHYRDKPLKELKIADTNWGSKHRNFIHENYRKHPFFEPVFSEVDSIFANKSNYLADIILQSMEVSMRLLNINTRTVLQSQLAYDHQAKKEQLVLNLLKLNNATHYLSGTGAKSYQDAANFTAAGIRLEYASFSHPGYVQKNSTQFIPGLSCLDLLFNVGIEQARLLLSGITSP